MIESIIMKSCATYSDVGAIIEDCKKINFFYGANGSGKSTIGNFLSNQQNPLYTDCELKWNDHDHIDVFVYNKDFKQRHFNEDIEGIFTLGESRIEDIDEINKLKEDKVAKDEELNKKKLSLKNKVSEEEAYTARFQKKIWDVVFKANELDFKEVFKGLQKSKEKFEGEVLKRWMLLKVPTRCREDLKKSKEILFDKDAKKYNVINIYCNEVMNEIARIECNRIWKKVVIGNKEVPVAKLIQYLGNGDWVNTGRKYIKNSICPFCQQETISNNFEKDLNEFFNGEYENDLRNIKFLIAQYKVKSDELVSKLRGALNKGIIGINVDEYNNLLERLNLTINNNLKIFESKENEPGRIIEIGSTKSLTDDLLEKIKRANQVILQHNLLVDNQKSEKSKLIDEVWSFILYENKWLIESYIEGKNKFFKAKNGITDKIDSCQKELDNLNSKISALERGITSVQPTINEINRSLEAYGFTNFKIVRSPRKEHFYQIQRSDGTLVTNTLSEGEETFITFLYFLQLAKGSKNSKRVSAKKILVLDDPISSLDSTVLYIVSSLVRALIDEVIGSDEGKLVNTDVQQIFIFTHNVFFYKEASFIDRRIKESDDIHHWIISKKEDKSLIKSFGKINPIKTSYELLWEEIKNDEEISSVTIQNAMRRIIENYFSMLGTGINKEIVDKFETLEEKIVCRSLISWINEGSHMIPEDLYVDSYSNSIDKYKMVFRKIFEKTGHIAHYEMMMRENK